MLSLVLLGLVAFVAGIQNALAGGGSFLLFPTLLFTGLDARAANITSTLALFPGQVTTGLAGRRDVADLPTLRFRSMVWISLVGGALGAALLLSTPSEIFTALVPWLVLFATAVFAWGLVPQRARGRPSPPSGGVAAGTQFLISIYGGYFGGGIGILMLAVLTLSGLGVRSAAATKNVLAAAMNASAVLIFAFSRDVAWIPAAVIAVAAIVGGQIGAYALHRVNERALRIGIIVLGLALTAGLFWRSAHP
jgi:uncharacterized membrane protein YfcA